MSRIRLASRESNRSPSRDRYVLERRGGGGGGACVGGWWLVVGVGIGVGGMAPIPVYSRPGSTSGKLVHGRSLANATRVISHDAHNAALSPVLRVPCPETSRGTGYTTAPLPKHSSEVRVIWPTPCRTQGLFFLSRSTHYRVQSVRSGVQSFRFYGKKSKPRAGIFIDRVLRGIGRKVRRESQAGYRMLIINQPARRPEKKKKKKQENKKKKKQPYADSILLFVSLSFFFFLFFNFPSLTQIMKFMGSVTAPFGQVPTCTLVPLLRPSPILACCGLYVLYPRYM